MTHIVNQECTCYCPETRYSCRGYGCEEDPNGIYTTFDSCVEAYNAGACIPPLCDGVICDDPNWIIDLDSCLCAPPPTNPPPPPPTPTPTLPCDRDSSLPNGIVTVKGYAYYFDTVTSVTIPGLPDPLQSRCAGGHRCNRATFIPQLSFGSLSYNSTDISLNNAPCNGSCDRSATFEFNNIALSSFATPAKFNLLCKNANTNCHNGITWVVLTTEVDGNTIKLFDSCITPGRATALDYGCPECDCNWDGNGFVQFNANCNSLLVPATWSQVGAYEWFLQGNLSCGDPITSTIRCDPSKPASPCYQKWSATVSIPCVSNLFLRTPDESCTCDTPPIWPFDGDSSTCNCCTTPTPTPTPTSSQTPTPTPTPTQTSSQTPTPTPTPSVTPSVCHYATPCDQGYIFDIESCECVPPPTVTDTPVWTDDPPVVPCTPTSSFSIEGYAYYFDSITTVNIPGIGDLISPCAGGHWCDRTDFMPKLIGDGVVIEASNSISLNNRLVGGDRSDSFSFSITDASIFQSTVNITLECLTAGGCHNGVTWIVLTYTDPDTGQTSLAFSDCVVPGSLDGIDITCDYSNYSDYTDTVPPSPPVIIGPTLTSDPTPPITGEGEPGTTITVYDGDNNPIGTTTVNTDGTWEMTPSTPLPDGVDVLTATSTDSAGNTSNPSIGLPITINTQQAWLCQGVISGCAPCYGCIGFDDVYASESECVENCTPIVPTPSITPTISVTPTITPTITVTPSVTPTITPTTSLFIDYSDYTNFNL